MDPTNNLAPLFEAQLILLEPNIIFVPSLDSNADDGFKKLITGLINDIIKIASIVPRFSKTVQASYEEEINANQDISDIKADILSNVDRVIEEAYEYCDNFQNYSYIWLDDRKIYLDHFLTYSRQLTGEEIDWVNLKDSAAPKPNPPKMEQFREQIDHFENLYNEVERMQTEHIFSSWFKVDVKPFKQALLNTIRKWGNMFKDHLVDTVTNSLTDLGQFIRSADEGLQQTVVEGDYQALVNIMGYLLHVKERQATTDEMFGPLRETIELLKFYDQDIPEEVNVYLQELPEQWNSTKKIAITVKQQVAPLQAAEVVFIRKKIAEFDVRVLYYREVFKKYLFFQYTCHQPYSVLDKVDKDLRKFETEMKNIHESGSLFEVNVPDFKVLKQCRKDLKMLKVLS
jgi:dynein heavy chain